MSGGHGETLGDGHYTRVLRCLDNRRVHCPTQYQHEVQEDVAALVCIIELSKGSAHLA